MLMSQSHVPEKKEPSVMMHAFPDLIESTIAVQLSFGIFTSSIRMRLQAIDSSKAY